MTQRTIRAARSAAEAMASLPSLALRGELSRRTRARFTVAIVALGPLLAVVTGVALSGGERGPVRQEVLRGVFLADLVYILVIAGLVAWRVAALISARRARSATR